MSSIGERLRKSREKKELSQIQVKELTGINNKTLSGYENNVSTPDPEAFKLLATLYDVTIDYLMGRENIKKYSESEEKSSLSKQAEDIIKIDPDLFVQMCRASYLPEEDRKKIREYSAMLLEKHLRQEKGKIKTDNHIPK
jgi:transcriptional regulator with XRE-family HTH domain